MRQPNVLSIGELKDLADRATAGEECLERLFNRAVWGGTPPTMWRDWPQEARDMWDQSVRMCHPPAVPDKRPTRRLRIVPAEAIWSAVVASSRHPDIFQRLTWADLSRRIGLPPKASQYYARRWGFSLDDQPPYRELVSAPCMACTDPFPFSPDAPSYYCPSCADTQAEKHPSANPAHLCAYKRSHSRSQYPDAGVPTHKASHHRRRA